MIEIQWHDIDPKTHKKRYLRAECFADEWRFLFRAVRRSEWEKIRTPTQEMWEHVLDSLKRRYQRREGVDEEDVKRVEAILKEVIRIRKIREG